MRHTLMHTGALRFLYERSTQTAYTWRVYSAGPLPDGAAHYTLSDETSNYQNAVIDAVAGKVTTVRALNVQLSDFSGDIERVARYYTTALSSDPAMQATCEAIYPKIRVQTF
ncbi:hypothetical protein A5658_02965 [Mycobacterium sp. 1245111.1]|uniref:hypothetical protein n=1 Tax=Mycobacterium sp. 1245111.1 TaxID=1834073 RepID=UPI000800DE62|nr:hypothetical protein [Mycobacterium sp. 1245111.1]OBK39822.1 hypothetical protein A5658_02965 [Mycobacterium sp. 1245111.1]